MTSDKTTSSGTTCLGCASTIIPGREGLHAWQCKGVLQAWPRGVEELVMFGGAVLEVEGRR